MLQSHSSSSQQQSVYKAVIEFIKLDDWQQEVYHLVSESTTGKVIDRETKQMEEKFISIGKGTDRITRAALEKLKLVYGKTKVEQYNNYDPDIVIDEFVNDSNILELLSPKDEEKYRTETITIGNVDATKMKDLMSCYNSNDKSIQRERKELAKNLRDKINQFICSTTSGNDKTQKWPLVRKVTIFGPWKVLMYGCCLVDLPGTKDNITSRAEVAEEHIKTCDRIWIVAPITRAANDGIAQDLLGQQVSKHKNCICIFFLFNVFC